MKTNSINNQTFGLQITAPSFIRHAQINKFLETPLVKEIDKKYPNAVTKVSIYNMRDFVNDEPISTLVAKTILEKGKTWDFAIDSHEDLRAFEAFILYAQKSTLEDVENNLLKESKDDFPKIEIKITQKKESFLSKFKKWLSLK